MTDRLLAAYLRTTWHLAAPPGEIRIGEPAAAAALLARLDASTAAIITACNPRSTPLDDAENRRRSDELRDSIVAAGWRCLPCVGVGDAATSPAWREESCLVTGCARRDAVGYGRRWDQNAVVWWERGLRPVLLVTTDGFGGRRVGGMIADG